MKHFIDLVKTAIIILMLSKKDRELIIKICSQLSEVKTNQDNLSKGIVELEGNIKKLNEFKADSILIINDLQAKLNKVDTENKKEVKIAFDLHFITEKYNQAKFVEEMNIIISKYGILGGTIKINE